MQKHARDAGQSHKTTHAAHYIRLGAMLVLSFLAMFALMYAMVDRFSNVFPNLNQAYMAGLMTAPMAIIEILLMGSMYPDRKLNAVAVSLGVMLLGACWFGIRHQTGISDKEFLKSMVPHHGGAILMCQQAALKDPDLQHLCQTIISSQQQEIDFMKAKLQEGVSP